MAQKHARKLRRRAKREERQRDKEDSVANPSEQPAGQGKPNEQEASTTPSGSAGATTSRASTRASRPPTP